MFNYFQLLQTLIFVFEWSWILDLVICKGTDLLNYNVSDLFVQKNDPDLYHIIKDQTKIV